MDKISQLFYLHGIGYEYTNFNGEHVIFNENIRYSALSACGIDGFDNAKVSEKILEIDVKPWLQVVEPVSLIDQSNSLFKLKYLSGGSAWMCKQVLKNLLGFLEQVYI